MKTVSVGFRCSEEVKKGIDEMAQRQGLTASIYIGNSMQDIVSGKVISRTLLQSEVMQLMKGINAVRINNPDIDLSEIESAGERICQISL